MKRCLSLIAADLRICRRQRFRSPGHESHTVALNKLAGSNRVDIDVRGEYRHIQSNGIPAHAVGAVSQSGQPQRDRRAAI